MIAELFKDFEFSSEQIHKYITGAGRDISIAKGSKEPEVRFQFSYNALIKCAYALIGFKEKKRVRSQVGHHVKLIEKMAEILNDKTIDTNGNAMRSKRNKDLYFAEAIITEKEANDYLNFVTGVFNRIKKEITKDK